MEIHTVTRTTGLGSTASARWLSSDSLPACETSTLRHRSDFRREPLSSLDVGGLIIQLNRAVKLQMGTHGSESARSSASSSGTHQDISQEGDSYSRATGRHAGILRSELIIDMFAAFSLRQRGCTLPGARQSLLQLLWDVILEQQDDRRFSYQQASV